MFSLIESKVNEFIELVDVGLRTLTGQYVNDSKFEGNTKDQKLSPMDAKKVGALMRVNHVGEVCAQGLYLGQSISAKSNEARRKLQRAAEEERKHLGWCAQRLEELDDSTSVLSPFFFASAAGLGVLTGLLGDRISLGFVEATEEQVVAHLDRHLEALPEHDLRSREILSAIRREELDHGERAIEAGGAKYPTTIRELMTLVSKLMTETTKHI